MTKEFSKEEYETRIAELETKLKEKEDTSFTEIKEKYEKIIEDKNHEIEELNQTITETKEKTDNAVNDLNDEVQARLEANEKYKEILSTVKELQHDKAVATVDKFISEGKILPAQRDTALKLCLNDNDTFMELYRDAQPIIELKQKKSKKVNADLTRLVDYFKN